MEELEEMLIDYNLSHMSDIVCSPWSKQYCHKPFPRYWEKAYTIMQRIPRNKSIIEIGCGIGDITTIFLHLGFNKVMSYEKSSVLYHIAKRRMWDMFKRKDLIINKTFPDEEPHNSDILVLLNCVYKENVKDKNAYINTIKRFYNLAGSPEIFVMEVIDSSYTKEDDEFPVYLRLSNEDVHRMFRGFHIESWPTYTYPTNKKSKTLYLIEKNENTYCND